MFDGLICWPEALLSKFYECIVTVPWLPGASNDKASLSTRFEETRKGHNTILQSMCNTVPVSPYEIEAVKLFLNLPYNT